jgi:hypothetical protein
VQTQKLLIHPEPANAEPNSQAVVGIGTSLILIAIEKYIDCQTLQQPVKAVILQKITKQRYTICLRS